MRNDVLERDYRHRGKCIIFKKNKINEIGLLLADNNNEKNSVIRSN